MKSKDGFAVTVNAIGAGLVSITVPAPNGPVDVLLRYEDLADYRDDSFCVGATVGRYANRIRNAEFPLDGRMVLLDPNDAARHCLHGGEEGLHRQVWTLIKSANGDQVDCHHRSIDGTGGFPGNVDITVSYKLLDDWSVAIDYMAITDRDTILSLANHAYFNLDGAATDIADHIVNINADHYTPVDDSLIPTGNIERVDATEFDLSEPQRLGHRVFDTNYALPGPVGELRKVAEVVSKKSGISLTVLTTQAGLQFYTGDQLEAPFTPRQGLCLEAQNFPNAPNEANFPDATLKPGVPYSQRTIYQFGDVTN